MATTELNMQKGTRFNVTFALTSAIYEGFMTVFNDRNPLHTNHDFAVKKGFESKVMHGNILNGFISYFVGEFVPVKDVIIQTQEIKFIKPVYLGDVLLLSLIHI